MQLGIRDAAASLRDPSGVRARSRVADDAAERDEDREGLDLEAAIAELLGQLERRARVLEPRGEALPEADRPGEAAVDLGAQRRVVRRSRQGLLEQRDPSLDALEAGEQDQRAGAQRPVQVLGQEVGRELAGACPLARRLLRPRRVEPAPPALAAARQAA